MPNTPERANPGDPGTSRQRRTSRRKRSRDPEATRSGLLEAARAAFAQSGFAATTVQEIARRAGVNHALVNYYFGSKEGLWVACMRKAMEHLAEGLRHAGLDRDPPTAYFSGVLRALFQFHRTHPDLIALLAWANRENDERLNGVQPLIQECLARLTQAQGEGALRADIAPEYLLFMVVGLSEYWFQSKRAFAGKLGVPPESLDDDAYAQAVQRVLRDGWRSAPPTPASASKAPLSADRKTPPQDGRN